MNKPTSPMEMNNPGQRLSSVDMDMEYIHKSLTNVNIFEKKKLVEKLPPILMMEMDCEGNSEIKSITLRELLNYIIFESRSIDREESQRREHDREEKMNQHGDFENKHDLVNKEESKTNELLLMTQSKLLLNLNELDQNKSVTTLHHQTSRLQKEMKQKSHYISKPHGYHASEYYPHYNNLPQNDEFYAVNEVKLRDLRRLDFQLNSNDENSVIVRRHVVLFAMDPIRAIVMATKLILIVPNGADSLLKILEQHMKAWTQHHHQFHPDDSKNPSISESVNGGGGGGHDEHSSNLPDPYGMDNSKNVSFSSNPSLLNKPLPRFPQPMMIPSISYEVHSYEALLTTVKSLEMQEFDHISENILNELKYYNSSSLLPIEVQERTRLLKNQLALMHNRVNNYRRVLQELTEDDEDMALMNLTQLKMKPSLYHLPLQPEIKNMDEEIEELLESYLTDFNALESKINILRSQIQSAEELVSVRLDISRNELLIANTIFAVLSCSIGFAAKITGVFGMNLDNTRTIQPLDNVFYPVVAATYTTMIVMFISIVWYLYYSGMIPKRIKYQPHKPTWRG